MIIEASYKTIKICTSMHYLFQQRVDNGRQHPCNKVPEVITKIVILYILLYLLLLSLIYG